MDQETGRERWLTPIEWRNTYLTSGDGAIYFLIREEKIVSAIDVQTGSLKQKFTINFLPSSRAVFTNKMLCLNSSDGNIYALDADTGQEMWKLRINRVSFITPLAIGDVIYAAL